MEKKIKFWAVYSNILNILEKDITFLETLRGEELEAGIYFSDWLSRETNKL
jgi:hypothetical protein